MLFIRVDAGVAPPVFWALWLEPFALSPCSCPVDLAFFSAVPLSCMFTYQTLGKRLVERLLVGCAGRYLMSVTRYLS